MQKRIRIRTVPHKKSNDCETIIRTVGGAAAEVHDGDSCFDGLDCRLRLPPAVFPDEDLSEANSGVEGDPVFDGGSER